MRLFTVGLAALSLPLAVGATPADAAPATSDVVPLACQNPVPRLDKPTRGSVISDEAPLRIGPNEGCRASAIEHKGAELIFYCYVTNSSGNTWTFVQNPRVVAYGWIWDAHLSGYGSPNRC
ncbi:hypothetical protein O7606_27210 [Micromonospora sp. WMMD882]|uniref:hypothetical protein n=1 Tax=Micromonospora sp. WMMD882 TaxID=3015151 RepID=UPI00248AC7F4|nr:hypothetical protein [Micromonospora sp. WMMD882]WBB79772.1 hypothetical protein O7606_27210 [Micromonospora sp. WMMD882]